MSVDKPNTPDSVGCFHCGLPIAGDADFHCKLDEQTRDFCCFACQSVCEAIYEAGMQGYYQRTPQGALLAPPPTPPRDMEMYDLAEVQQEFVRFEGDLRDAHLLVEGIHCAACVWLIERTMLRVPGVSTANVNLAGKRLHLRWDEKRVKLSALIKRLSQIGYAGVPYDPETAEGAMKKANRSMLFRLFFAGFTMMNMNLITIALYSGADQGQFVGFFRWLAFALATPTLLYSGFPFLKGAGGGAAQCTPDDGLAHRAWACRDLLVFALRHPEWPGRGVFRYGDQSYFRHTHWSLSGRYVPSSSRVGNQQVDGFATACRYRVA